MQIFANGKWRYYPFIEFYVIHSNFLRGKFDHSTTLKYNIS